MKYVSTTYVSLPYPETANSSTRTTDGLSNELSFGHDYTDNSTQPQNDINNNTNVDLEDDETTTTRDDVSKNYEVNSEDSTRLDDLSDVDMTAVETRDYIRSRSGRSQWPTTVTIVNEAKSHTSRANLNNDFNSGQTNIFAIPMDMSSDEFSKPKLEPPPFVFTPVTSFTDSYAQLTPYKNRRNYSTIERVMKYLREDKGTVEQSVADSPSNEIQSKIAMMKVKGTYIMPLDKRRPGEIIVSELENSQGDDKFLNGHAYVSDPFVKFRPDNLLEINKLIPAQSGRDIGPRFRRPVTFVPKSTTDVDLIPTHSSARQEQTSASHTIAIFHPPQPKPPLIKRPPPHVSREKPLSVTLDIYPVTMDADSGIQYS